MEADVKVYCACGCGSYVRVEVLGSFYEFAPVIEHPPKDNAHRYGAILLDPAGRRVICAAMPGGPVGVYPTP